MAESEEELNRVSMKVKEESEKVGLKLNIQKPFLLELLLVCLIVFGSCFCFHLSLAIFLFPSISASNEYSGLISFRID